MKKRNALRRRTPAIRGVLLACLCLAGVASCATREYGADETTLRRKIAQMLLIGFRGTTLAEAGHIRRDIAEHGIGGVILFDYDSPSKSRPRNITSPGQLRSLTASLQAIAPLPLLIAVDEEGGAVNRLKPRYGFPLTRKARELGEEGENTTAFYAAQTARVLRETGCNLNLAPCVDLDINPKSRAIGVYGRSFSADPQTVTGLGRIWIQAHTEAGVLSCLKHFPGHGSSDADTHAGFVDVSSSWKEDELIPYRELIREKTVRVIMTSHVYNARLDTENPATLSGPTLSGLLRGKLGFDGVIISDDLVMGAIAGRYSFDDALEKAVSAGVDILCFSNNGVRYDENIAEKAIDTIRALIAQGKIPRRRIEESFDRIMELKNSLK